MRTSCLVLAMLIALVGCASRQASQTDIVAAERRYAEIRAAAERAVSPDSGALGSRANPIKTRGPRGEREFLVRLRCPDGNAPVFDRLGSMGPGDDEHIQDSYVVTCPSNGPNVLLRMDMYHDHRETGALPPFRVLEYLPARRAQGCPPLVADADSSVRYVFTEFEVDSPAVTITRIPNPISASVSGYAFAEFVVDTTGRAEAAGRVIRGDPKEAEIAARIVDTLQFRPAIHHPGCRVRQRVAGGFQFQSR